MITARDTMFGDEEQSIEITIEVPEEVDVSFDMDVEKFTAISQDRLYRPTEYITIRWER